MKFGELLTAKIDAVDEKGRGTGLASGKRAAARGTIPGETVEGTFAGRDKGAIRLNDVRVTSASPDRIKEACPHAGTCGGCAWQHVRYERQAELKRALIARALAEAGLDLRVGALTPAAAGFRHRNRMDYVFGPDGRLGLKEAGRWDRYVDLATCLMLSEEAVEVLRRVRVWAKATGEPFWDNRLHAGFFRYLVIREGTFTGERMATLVTADGALPDPEGLVAALSPLCTTVYHGVNPLVTDLSIAKELRLLHGKTELHENVGGVTFTIHPNSFFQTNSTMAGVLLDKVRDLVLAGTHGKLLDLYCGSGFFSLCLAKEVDTALGIELDAFAIANAKRNAETNGIGNVRYRAEAAEDLSWSVERPDVVIVDPPRSGLHPKVRRTLLQHLPPRIVYVSCSPRALATDLRDLTSAYEAVSVEAVDLFPQTPHIETLVHLRRK